MYVYLPLKGLLPLVVITSLLCIADVTVDGGEYVEDVYRVRCPEREPSVYGGQKDVERDVKSKVQCVALCQRDPDCSAVTWKDQRCSLFTGGEKKCEDRAPGKGGLERIQSNRCSNDGDWQAPDSCNCTQNYTGAFCTLDMSDLCAAEQCLNGATCEVIGSTKICHCPVGFTGTLCETMGHPFVLDGGNLTVVMERPYEQGKWGNWDTCPYGSYAAGMELQIEKKRGLWVDDTAVNVVRLFCKEPTSPFSEVGNITSSTFKYGDLEPKVFCPDDYWIVAYRLHYEKRQTAPGDDDKAVCGIEVECGGISPLRLFTFKLKQVLSWWNTLWTDWSPQCPLGTAVCSIKTRVETAKSFIADGGGVTNVLLYCCEY